MDAGRRYGADQICLISERAVKPHFGRTALDLAVIVDANIRADPHARIGKA